MPGLKKGILKGFQHIKHAQLTYIEQQSQSLELFQVDEIDVAQLLCQFQHTTACLES